MPKAVEVHIPSFGRSVCFAVKRHNYHCGCVWL